MDIVLRTFVRCTYMTRMFGSATTSTGIMDVDNASYTVWPIETMLCEDKDEGYVMHIHLFLVLLQSIHQNLMNKNLFRA